MDAPLPTGVVTFLLTEVVGSTHLWESDSEAMARALERHGEVVAAVVDEHRGILLKPHGEGESTFSVFRKASDAIAAAWQLQQAIATEPWPSSPAIQLRMAVHTGEVVEREGDYYGAAVNRAARLRAEAEAGQVVVSQATAQLVADHLPAGASLVEVGSIELRDLARPESVHLLVDGRVAQPVTEPSGRMPLPGRLQAVEPTVFVGRSEHLAAIEAAFKATASGGCRLVVIAGEPGIGKTRLCQEVAHRLHAENATVRYGRCDDELGIPYQPWLEALGAAFPARRSLDGDAERMALFAGVVQFFATLTGDMPALLVLDDLHWADKPTLQLLQHVLNHADRMRLLIMATYRDTDISVDHPLANVLANLRREQGVERLALRGLADIEVVELIEAAAGYDLGEAGVAFAHELHREADGNPFFSIEILRHLAETGMAQPDDAGRWQFTEPSMSLPQSVREVVATRVRRLGDDVTAALTAASVIGRDFDLDLLSRMTGRDEDALIDALDQAAGGGVVSESVERPGHYSFAHALVQHTLYEDMSPARRQRAHTRVAEALEELVGASPGRRSGELARQWLAATRLVDTAKAVHYTVLAGEEAMARLAPDEAIRWFEEAESLLAHHGAAAPAEERARMLVGLGDARRQIGDPRHRETLLEAARFAQEAGRNDLLVAAALANNRGSMSARGTFDHERLAVLDAALVAVGGGDSAERALLLGIYGIEQAQDLERAEELSREALVVARRVDDPAVLARVLGLGFGVGVATPDNLSRRLTETDEAIVLSEQVGDPISLFLALVWKVVGSLQACRFDDARSACERLRHMADSVGHAYMRWIAPMLGAELALMVGDEERSEQLATEALEQGMAAEQPEAMSTYGAQLLDLRRRQGRVEEIEPLFTQAARDTPNLPALDLAVAQMYLDLGRVDEARAKFETFAAQPRSLLPFDQQWPAGMGLAADIAVRLGDRTTAQVISDQLVPWRDLTDANIATTRGAFAHWLAWLAALLGDRDRADEYFAQALDIYQRMPSPYLIALINLDRERAALILDAQEGGNRPSERRESTAEE